MKKSSIILISLLWVFPLFAIDSAVTVKKPFGRWGDQLLMVIKGKWITHECNKKYQHNLPFLYKSFKYSNQLIMHTKEKHFSSHKYFKRVVPVKNIPQNIQPHILYEVDFYASIDWKKLLHDTEFMNELKESIAPVFELPSLDIPSNTITIAVHIRKGSNGDGPLSSPQEYQMPTKKRELPPYDKAFPLKFLPLQYYIDQIKYIASFFNGLPLYIHIFTDASDPSDLVQKIKEKVNIPSISYGFFGGNDRYATSVVEDFFIMAQKFDILIRSGSNFSAIADLIGEHKIIIKAVKAEWINNNILVAKKVVTIAKDEQFAQRYNIPYQNEIISYSNQYYL